MEVGKRWVEVEGLVIMGGRGNVVRWVGSGVWGVGPKGLAAVGFRRLVGRRTVTIEMEFILGWKVWFS